jgi:hypothetical protein
MTTVELLGRELISLINAEDRADAAGALARLRAGAASARRGQLRYQRADGTIGWLDLSAASLAARGPTSCTLWTSPSTSRPRPT